MSTKQPRCPHSPGNVHWQAELQAALLLSEEQITEAQRNADELQAQLSQVTDKLKDTQAQQQAAVLDQQAARRECRALQQQLTASAQQGAEAQERTEQLESELQALRAEAARREAEEAAAAARDAQAMTQQLQDELWVFQQRMKPSSEEKAHWNRLCLQLCSIRSSGMTSGPRSVCYAARSAAAASP